jgi:NAD(P)-dependent dehydrogenase (short-subunit alcohol dehydrogenase family)
MFNPMDLSGRSILVTGASSGIGRSTSIQLSRLGAKLILVARDNDRLRDTEQQLNGNCHRVEPFDLKHLHAIPDWLKELAQQEGEMSGLVHCAGVHSARPLRFLDVDKLEELMRVNALAALQLVKGFRQKGVRASKGSVVLLSSVMALVGQAGVSAYCASKGALTAMARSLALELAAEGIRVNCVAPGMVESEMTSHLERSLTGEQFAAVRKMHPLGIGHTDDVAHAVSFLLADTGRWITGTTLVVDGGYTAH